MPPRCSHLEVACSLLLLAALGACGLDAGGANPTTQGTATPPDDGGSDRVPSIGRSEDAAASPGTAGCEHLNIGILGNQGQNPSAHFADWLRAAGTSVQRIQTAAPTPPLDAAALQPFDVVIVDWLTRDYTPAEATVVRDFVANGGALVAMSGYDDRAVDDWHANSLLSSVGAAYAGSTSWGPVTRFATHPVTAGLTSVTFTGGYAVAALGAPGATQTPIAFLTSSADGGVTPVGVAIELGRGRALVWGDEWIEFDSEWNSQAQIQRLWVQVFAWLAPSSKCTLTPPR